MEEFQHTHFFTKFRKHTLNICLNPKTTVPSILLAEALTASYIYFSSYKPKSLERINEIKGSSTEFKNTLFPLPLDAQNVSNDKFLYGSQATFLTSKDALKIQNFYKTILLGDKWILDSQQNNNITTIYKYKKDNDRAIVIASPQKDTKQTLAAVKFTSKN